MTRTFENGTTIADINYRLGGVLCAVYYNNNINNFALEPLFGTSTDLLDISNDYNIFIIQGKEINKVNVTAIDNSITLTII